MATVERSSLREEFRSRARGGAERTTTTLREGRRKGPSRSWPRESRLVSRSPDAKSLAISYFDIFPSPTPPSSRSHRRRRIASTRVLIRLDVARRRGDNRPDVFPVLVATRRVVIAAYSTRNRARAKLSLVCRCSVSFPFVSRPSAPLRSSARRFNDNFLRRDVVESTGTGKGSDGVVTRGDTRHESTTDIFPLAGWVSLAPTVTYPTTYLCSRRRPPRQLLSSGEKEIDR